MNSRIKIAARHSDLARLQAYRVGDSLKAAHPSLEVSYDFRASLGDQNLQDPLWKMPEKGVFTEDFVGDLIEGSADLVVHSWKDLPTEPRKNTEIVATLPRADVRDLLLFRKDRLEAAKKTGTVKILTSSPRRAYNLEPFFKTHLPFEVRSIEFLTVRGNIPTRLTKMLTQDVDGIIVAKAAIDRLLEAQEREFGDVQNVIRGALEKSRFMVLPLAANPTAAAQGALAVEIRKDRADLRELLSAIHCSVTFRAVQKEREILASYGGGCHQKIGVTVLERDYGSHLFLKGLTDAGEVLNQRTLENKAAVTRCESESKCFPLENETLFERREIESLDLDVLRNARYLLISRENALPQSAALHDNAVIWTAGVKTWQALASRGIWVSGTSESLGEKDSVAVSTITQRAVPWMRLTHTQAVKDDQNVVTLPTYELVPKTNPPDLKSKTHFYWMSGSAFDRALELAPEIASRFHACGPGKTLDHLRSKLGREVAVFVSLEQFRNAVLSSDL